MTWPSPGLLPPPILLETECLSQEQASNAQQGQWGHSGTGEKEEGDPLCSGASCPCDFSAGYFLAVSGPTT